MFIVCFGKKLNTYNSFIFTTCFNEVVKTLGQDFLAEKTKFVLL